MRTRALIGFGVVCMACVREYHPEYDPVTVVNVEQREIAEVRVGSDADADVDASLPAPTPSAQLTAPMELASPAPPPPRRPIAVAASDGDERDPATPAWSHDARAACRAGDAASCRTLPGVHINGNVRIGGSVTIFGDVYVNDAKQ